MTPDDWAGASGFELRLPHARIVVDRAATMVAIKSC
jgi:hypothetical protein